MHQLKNIKWLHILMVLTKAAIAAFQYYWLEKAYDREKRTLERQTNMLFRETVGQLQATKLRIDQDSGQPSGRIIMNVDTNSRRKTRVMNQKLVSMMNVMVQKYKDSGHTSILRDSTGTYIFREANRVDTLRIANRGIPGGKRDRLVQFLFDVDSMQDSIKVKEL